ncbi:MAG: SPOR domain-containing protein, partial [Alphaproteobacteria bacterium]|nr:SPOR domain-containing protein [Alphaproteobacteria bacterium]
VAVEPAPAPAPVEPAPARSVPTDGYMVQIASFPTPAEAEASWQKLAGKHADLLTGEPHEVMEADLGAKGVWHRLRVGPYAAKDEADALCASLKGRGQDCLVRKM